MSDLIIIVILILFMAVVQFIANIMVRRFEWFCYKVKLIIKSKLVAFHQAPEREREELEKKKETTVLMEDISTNVPPLDDI